MTPSSLKIRVQNHFILYVIFILTNFILTPATIVQSKSLRELPNERDDFESMRAQNRVYVDKSEYLMKLLGSGDRFFRMCRPGRFGKSSFLQMMKSFFRGRKELFEGLKIYDEHDWRTTYPVIFLDFSALNISSPDSFATCLEREILHSGEEYGIEIDEKLPLAPNIYEDTLDSKIGQLLDGLIKRGKIVLLVDEYDWPLRKYFHHFDYGEAHEFHLIIMAFFRQFERRVDHIVFLFFTCTTVTPWHRYYKELTDNPEPEPIVLEDISYDPAFSGAMGLTGDELQTYMKPHIDAMTNNPNKSEFRGFFQKLRKRYNGYCFSRDVATPGSKCRLYNFHSVLSCLRGKNLDYLWHPAGDLKYNVFHDYDYIDTVKRNYLTRYKNFFKSQGFTVSRRLLEDETFLSRNWKKYHYFEPVKRYFTVMNMLQFGYVTVQGYNEGTDEFTVNFPNDEMRESYVRATLKLIFGRAMSSAEFFQECNSLRESMLAGRAEYFFERLHKLVSKPHQESGTVPMLILIDEVFQICHFSCSEILNGENGMKVDYLFYSDSETAARRKTNPRSDGLEVTLSRQITSRFKFEFQTSACDAMNAALGVVNEKDFREASRNRTTHLFGINVNEDDEWVNDWIQMTYSDGKFSDLQASSPLYFDMYRPYIELKSYSPLGLPSRKYIRIQFKV